jgi:HAD superfamily hydrolase (TIGR01509 family)
MQWPEVVIFDCDGVLVDSELIALGQTRAALDAAGLSLTHDQATEKFLGLSLDSIIEKVECDLNVALPANFRADLSREILGRFTAELKGIAGVREAVEGLSCRVCVASSSPLERIRRALSLTGYDALFEPNIFSASMASRGKPHPDLFLYAARQMGAEPRQCLVIEDSAAGVTAAVSAGMAVFGFVGGSHLGGASHSERLSSAGASVIFNAMGQLPAIVARHSSASRVEASSGAIHMKTS